MNSVSELIQIKVEHVQAGYFDIYAKGALAKESRHDHCIF